jgi:hypothetical protein
LPFNFIDLRTVNCVAYHLVAFQVIAVQGFILQTCLKPRQNPVFLSNVVNHGSNVRSSHQYYLHSRNKYYSFLFLCNNFSVFVECNNASVTSYWPISNFNKQSKIVLHIRTQVCVSTDQSDIADFK